MTRYEQGMYERDLPGIRKSLESIAKTLKKLETIISDPGDEIEHIYERTSIDYPAKMRDVWKEDPFNHDDMD